MMPLYGFLEGDTLGLLILADENESAESLLMKLKRSAKVRVPLREGGQVFFAGNALAPGSRLKDAGIQALDRFDVRWRDS